MGRKQKTIHYLYKTTCKVTGRYYIGMHSTCDLEDGYLGSGRRLTRSIRKHGKENHVKEILEFFDCREALIEAEKRAITEEMLSDASCMNLMSGGTGGFVSIESAKKGMEKTNEILIEKFGPDFKSVIAKNYHDGLTEAEKIKRGKNIKQGQKDIRFQSGFFLGKRHSDETKRKMSESSRGGGIGNMNSQFGTMWITNGIENRKVNKEDPIPEGWFKGRKFAE